MTDAVDRGAHHVTIMKEVTPRPIPRVYPVLTGISIRALWNGSPLQRDQNIPVSRPPHRVLLRKPT
jgi:hypothetical protein